MSVRTLIMAAALFALAGCAAQQAIRDAGTLMDAGKPADAFKLLDDALVKNPDSIELRTYSLRERERWVQRWAADADRAVAAGQYDTAEALYRQILLTDETAPAGKLGLQKVTLARKHEAQLAGVDAMFASNPDGARAILKEILSENPRNKTARTLLERLDATAAKDTNTPAKLATAFRQPISLSFRDQNLSSVFDMISRITKINFIFDKDVSPSLKATIYGNDTTTEDAIDLLLRTNQLARKTLNQNTVLIYPKTPEKEKEYRELVMRTFYLSNADSKAVAPMIRQMVHPKEIYNDDRLNTIVVRDSPETMAVIERLVAAQDLPQSEVVLEVQVLEVNRNDILDLGLRYPSPIEITPYGSGYGGLTPAGIAGVLTLEELANVNRGNTLVNFGSPAFKLSANYNKGHNKILANPNIRVKNREKAQIQIGNRVPVVTTTTNNGVTTEMVNYQDVGLTFRAEPNISLEGEVTVKLGLEVSNIVNTITTKTGLIAYEIGQRRAETILGVKDGETQALGGLLERTHSIESNAIPGLGNLPGLDRIFGSRKDTDGQDEIILLITPRIVRNLNLPPGHVGNFSSGVEQSPDVKPLRLRDAPPAASAQGPQAAQ
ncbi:hypothetical protein GCM10025771_39970 [Niveibacterium umoris]|uniref:General secretion pathway protein D n=1 Tax=Niveibacterium umoris TaxID=1193620 RepID=A0A840BB89_9RHOO|nr:secretin N-terminal domain-containing protein [Niveibacterium umoris]MBB4010801.1 general secretion pathway protein D [Niveibacterium umoris]